MKKLNILIITYDWPPRNSIAVHRPYAWAKCWARLGYSVTVLTAKKCVYDEPLDLHMPKLDGVTVLEIPYRAAGGVRKALARKSHKEKVFECLKKNSGLIRKILRLNLDIRDAWAPKATEVALELNATQRFDVVVSSYGPRACHFIGRFLKERDPSIFWIADYRDMWSIRHNSSLSGRAKRKEQKLEKQVIREADVLTTVSTPLVEQLQGFLGKEVWLVSNGYDLALSIVEERINNYVGPVPGELKIIYTGMIYPGWQDPSPLFEAINELLREKKITSSQIRILFFGKRQPGLADIVSRYNALSYVKIHGHVTRQRALEEQAKGDVLLLMESGSEAAKGVLTGKIFEYMVSGKPVMSLGSKQDSAIGMLINETGIGVLCQQNVSDIKAYLMGMIEGGASVLYEPNMEMIKIYNRAAQSEAFLEKIKKTIAKMSEVERNR